MPIPCPVAVRERGAIFGAVTQDVGARGCRLVLDRPVEAGAVVQLRFDRGRDGPPLDVLGQVAWSRAGARSAGVAFVSQPRDPTGASSRDWIDGLAAAHLRRLAAGWAGSGDALAQLRDVVVQLGIPPTDTLERSEIALVRLARDGVPFGEVVRSREALEVLARLLDRGVLSVSRATPDPEGWKQALPRLLQSLRQPGGAAGAPERPGARGPPTVR